MCVFVIRARISCSVAIKLTVVAGRTRGQVIVGLMTPVLRFTESNPSISAFSFVDDSHFLIIVLIDFRFLQDLIGRHPTFEFNSINIIFSCIRSNMVAEGIGGRRRAP